ncbi:MAG: class I SAM-dependent methyltransferase [Gemmatimonadaceae bacterium]
MEPADHFSGVAKAYAAFRPHYPRELFDYVASIAPRHHRAWDCGAGSGQATTDLAERFDEVIGTDLSAEQIAKASARPNIRYLVAPAESVPIESGTVDLTTVAQALHWFDHAPFYDEVRRVSVPGAVIAAWTYASPRMEGDVGAALHRLMYETVGPYWPPERQYVEQEYRTIPFPFTRLESPRLVLEESWSLEQVAGYARSWSATARYVAARGSDPVVTFEARLRESWRGSTTRAITWPLVLIAGRVD